MKKDQMADDFYKELSKDNVIKMSGGQYIITGKGDSWNEVKDEIEDIYKSWISSCELLGQGEEELLSRIDKSKLIKDVEAGKIGYYFLDKKGIIGQPFIVSHDDEEQRVNLYLLLLFITSKLSDHTKDYLLEFIKKEQIG